MIRRMTQTNFFLPMLFGISLLVRLLFFNAFLRDNPVLLAFDSGQYHRVAVNVANGKGFTNTDGTPHFYRLPGYPLFLVGCYKCLGSGPAGALWVQLVLASFIPVLIFLLCSLVLPGYLFVAIGASLVAVVHPGFLIMSGLVMAETLFVLLFLLFLFFLLRGVQTICSSAGLTLSKISVIPAQAYSCLKKKTCAMVICHSRVGGNPEKMCRALQVSLDPRLRGDDIKSVFFLVLAGSMLGLASLVRPLGPEVLAVVAIVMLLLHASMRSIVLVCAAWLAIISLWLIRNCMLTGFLFLHTLSGPHLLNHGAARVVMMAHYVPYETAKRHVVARYQQELDARTELLGRPLQEIECSRVAQKIATAVCWQYPLQTIKLGFINMLKTVFSLYSSELLFIDSGGQLPAYDAGRGVCDMIMRFVFPRVHNGWIVWVIYFEMLLSFLLLLGVVGCVLRYERAQAFFFTIPFITLFIILSSVCGFARLRLPIEPFLIMLAMSFWINFMTRKRVE